jgi:hypothetical protein
LVAPLPILFTEVWQSTRLTGNLADTSEEFTASVAEAYLRIGILNQRLQMRELYRVGVGGAMGNYHERRTLINEILAGAVADVTTRLEKILGTIQTLQGGRV